MKHRVNYRLALPLSTGNRHSGRARRRANDRIIAYNSVTNDGCVQEIEASKRLSKSPDEMRVYDVDSTDSSTTCHVFCRAPLSVGSASPMRHLFSRHQQVVHLHPIRLGTDSKLITA
jgi:hypothetical protein